jgi:hypothetical protein
MLGVFMFFLKMFSKYNKVLTLTCWLTLLSIPVLAGQNSQTTSKGNSNLAVPSDLKIVIYQSLTAYEKEEQGVTVRPKLTVTNATVSWDGGKKKANLSSEEMSRIFALAADAVPLPPDITSEVRFRCCGSPPHVTLFFDKALRETRKESQLQQLIETIAQEKGYTIEASSEQLKVRQEMMRKLNPTGVEIDRKKIDQTLSSGITLNPCQKNTQIINSPDGKVKVVVARGEGRIATVYFDDKTQTLNIKAICNNETQIAWNLELGYLFIREFIDRNAPSDTRSIPLNFNIQISAYNITSYNLVTNIQEKQ